MFTSLLKNVMKDTEEQSDEDVQGQGPERVPRAGVSVSVELGCVSLPAHNQSSSAWKPSEPHCSEISTDASSRRHVKVKVA